MALLTQPLNEALVLVVTVKIARKEKVCGNIVMLQCFPDMIAAVIVIATGKNKMDIFYGGIPANDAAMAPDRSSWVFLVLFYRQ